MRNDSDSPLAEGGQRGGRSRRPRRRRNPRGQPEGTPAHASSDEESGAPRAPLPRHELLNPKPIPGRLLEDKKPDLSNLLGEDVPKSEPVEDTDERKPRRRRRRGGRGGRRRDENDGAREEPDMDQNAAVEAPEAAEEAVDAPTEAAAPLADDFGAGIFDETPAAPPAPVAPAAAEEEEAPAVEPDEPEPEPEEPAADDFGLGIL